MEANADIPVEIRVRKPGLYSSPMCAPGDVTDWGIQEIQDWGSARGMPGAGIEVSLPEVCPWTCEEPFLYYFTVELGEDRAEELFCYADVYN